MMSTLCHRGGTRPVFFVKGAPESVIERCIQASNPPVLSSGYFIDSVFLPANLLSQSKAARLASRIAKLSLSIRSQIC